MSSTIEEAEALVDHIQKKGDINKFLKWYDKNLAEADLADVNKVTYNRKKYKISVLFLAFMKINILAHAESENYDFIQDPRD